MSVDALGARGSRGRGGASSAVAPVNGHTVQQLEQMLASARAAEAATDQAAIAQLAACGPMFLGRDPAWVKINLHLCAWYGKSQPQEF